MLDLLPQELLERLNESIVGQEAAKRALVIAYRQRWQRLRLPEETIEATPAPNVCLLGPRGVGKTTLVQKFAEILDAPFLSVSAKDIVQRSDAVWLMLMKFAEFQLQEKDRKAFTDASDKGNERLDTIIENVLVPKLCAFAHKKGRDFSELEVSQEQLDAIPKERLTTSDPLERRLRALYRLGALDDLNFAIREQEDAQTSERKEEPTSAGKASDKKKSAKKEIESKKREGKKEPTIASLRKHMRASLLTYRSQHNGVLPRDPRELFKITSKQVAQCGVIVIDCGHSVRDLHQALVSLSTNILNKKRRYSKFGSLPLKGILYVLETSATDFKSAELPAVLHAYFPLYADMPALTREEMRAVLTHTPQALVTRYERLFAAEKVALTFTPEGIDAIVDLTFDANVASGAIGAKRLEVVMARLFEELYFQLDGTEKTVTVDAAYVQARRDAILPPDLSSKYVF
ncbi:MAG: AAA family ATPase [Planctomycetia bacterium]|nr:AAA family ATPase [Planctomycetia bacterium]